ncbi:protein translocase subunit SecF [Alloacidobacterium dinghuense]|uniref:Protein-export membrane protein SecF n=1 Tax=Alloacidobacterium dinghuense TaxID=2763107 RepID=A0A7G8BG23_9BACT|nr:protein translocase subunit SecF [Alloacidobacterium dinghuense]QNI31493.1 protein translocase subunit SecF [Alloacidobacterium dinghuense]
MELFRDVKIDWLGKKWYFLGFSLIFSVAGILSLLFWHGLPQDVDFRGGTVVRVRFDQQPNVDHIRAAADKAGIKDVRIQTITGGGQATTNEVIISLAQSANEASLDQGRATILQTLEANYARGGAANQGKLDLDNVGQGTLAGWLAEKDPEHLGTTDAAQQHYNQQAEAIVGYRNTRSGLIDSIDNLSSVTTPAVLNEFKQDAYLSGFAVRNVEIVGPQVGAQLKKQALLATLYSLAGMLVYLWFRFELIYGVAAVVAVFHDTLITVGAFSLTNKEISLTVIAAILTLVGYSMNDTIVVFDRIRENLRLTRREPLADIVNRSINQTLSRTVLTSGLTFLTVLSLYVFGGEVLHGFSFALVIGILIGTYSSIAVAAPMLVAYQEWRQGRGRAAVLPAAKKARV